MANLNRSWKRWMATGCLHSTHACAEYQRNVRAFKAALHPDRHIELGDILETTALRSGARGTKDQAEPLQPDVNKVHRRNFRVQNGARVVPVPHYRVIS